jgi:hypothetical protein
MTANETRIQQGTMYCVALGQYHRFKVRAVRPAALPGWWWCEGDKTGDPIVLPEDALEASHDIVESCASG